MYPTPRIFAQEITRGDTRLEFTFWPSASGSTAYGHLSAMEWYIRSQVKGSNYRTVSSERRAERG